MKTFAQYLVESEKTFDYRIKIVGDIDSEFMKNFKDKLKKFDPVKISEPKKTPILSKPQDFPGFDNESVNIIDAEFRYPANLQQIQQMVRLLGLDENRLWVSELHWANGMDKELLGIQEQNSDLLNSDYPAPDAEQKQLKKDYAAVGKEKEVVKNSAVEAKWTVAGGKTPPAETTNDLPMGNKSPMTSVIRPPRPQTGFQK
jgi:hypothetical protein